MSPGFNEAAVGTADGPAERWREGDSNDCFNEAAVGTADGRSSWTRFSSFGFSFNEAAVGTADGPARAVSQKPVAAALQ